MHLDFFLVEMQVWRVAFNKNNKSCGIYAQSTEKETLVGHKSASSVDSVIVTWIGGKRQVLVAQKTNFLLIVEEEPDKENTFSLLWILFTIPVFSAFVFYKLRKRL